MLFAKPNKFQTKNFMINIPTLEILLGLGFLAGFVDSIAGGGGLITLPALLSVGVPPHFALGTNKLAATFGTFNASRTFIKKRIFNPLLWKTAIFATLFGALIGVLLSHFVSTIFLKHIIPLVILATAIYIAFFTSPQKNSPPAESTFKPKTKFSVVTGSLLGFYDGFLGPGTGSFWASTLMALYKLDLLTASAIARFMNFVSNMIALITFMILQNVDYVFGLSMGIGLFLGAQIGAHSAIRYGGKFIKPIFLVVIIGMAVHMMVVNGFF
jgi:uncharacterized protein